jgi:hypothetical protein
MYSEVPIVLCEVKLYGYVGNFTFSLQQSQRLDA